MRFASLNTVAVGLVLITGCPKPHAEPDASRDGSAADACVDAGPRDGGGPSSGSGASGAPDAGDPGWCVVDFPCEGATVCTGDRQYRRQETIGCAAFCGTRPCYGGACQPFGPVEDCPSGTACVATSPYNGACSPDIGPPFCDEDADDIDAGSEPCRPVTGCGDGVLNWRERCDDGNLSPGDGCSDACTVESGWDCFSGTRCHRHESGDSECSANACRIEAVCSERPSGRACGCPAQSLPQCPPLPLQSLGRLPNTDQVWPRAISRDGTTVVGSAYDSQAAGPLHSYPYVWRADGGASAIAVPNGADGQAFSVSGDGAVVGVMTSGAGSTTNGFALASAVGVSPIAFDGLYNTVDVSADGAAVVGMFILGDASYDAFRWTAATGHLDLGHLQLAQCFDAPDSGGCVSTSEAYAVSADGSTVVGVSSGYAFRWNESAGMQRLEPLASPPTSS
ncbi:MAG TPA: DUF4215 domain-containing protein, partial [Polyangiaceae bacterium]|nr:DUF4215 domain-containing protein [Polyangiaceae bacterium]